MRPFVILLILTALTNISRAQEIKESKYTFRFSGFIQHSMYMDTYTSTDTRDGVLLLFPDRAVLDSNNRDVNENTQFQMVAIQSRPRVSFEGPGIVGAKLTGLIEVDFLGTHQDFIQMIRLRHAYIKLSWEKIELLFGQYWHPMFSSSCSPNTVQHGAGVPFHPLNRSPQVRLTYLPHKSLNFLISLHSAGYHKSKGPTDAARNSGIPEIQTNAEYKNNWLVLGATAGYKFLQPRTVTGYGYKTEKTIWSYNLEAYSALKLKSFSIKVQGILGENLTNYVMLGGYGAAHDPEVVDDYSYSNLTTYSVWTDLAYKIKMISVGLFAAQSGNLGSTSNYYELEDYTRGGDIKKIYRISPRIIIHLNKLSFSFEYGMTGALYASDTNSKGRITATEDPVVNHRYLFSTKYSF